MNGPLQQDKRPLSLWHSIFHQNVVKQAGNCALELPRDLPTYSTPRAERSVVAPGNPNSYSCFKDSTPGRKTSSTILIQYFLDYTSNLSPACVRKNLGCKHIWIFLFYIFSEGGDWKSTWCSFHSRYLNTRTSHVRIHSINYLPSRFRAYHCTMFVPVMPTGVIATQQNFIQMFHNPVLHSPQFNCHHVSPSSSIFQWNALRNSLAWETKRSKPYPRSHSNCDF